MKALTLLTALCTLTFAAPAHADPPARPSAPVAARATPAEVASEGVVNVNTAAPDELERVPGIGPARADAIVRLRERVTHFRHVEDLVRVRGIGRATLRAMRPYLTLEGPTTLAERPGRRRASE